MVLRSGRDSNPRVPEDRLLSRQLHSTGLCHRSKQVDRLRAHRPPTRETFFQQILLAVCLEDVQPVVRAGGSAFHDISLRVRVDLPQIDLVGVGSRAPNFRAMDLRTGRPVQLSDYRGKVVLLNIWATYCQPCRIEMPAIERLSHRLAGTDFRVLAVSVDVVDSSEVDAFVKQLGLTFDVWHDQPGTVQRLYQTTGVPETFVINREGIIVKKVIGASEWDGPVNDVLIRRLLDES